MAEAHVPVFGPQNSGRNPKINERDEKLTPVHPGEILRSEFMEPMGITPHQLARDLTLTPLRIRGIVTAKREITADIASRRGRYFGLSATYWMNLQALYEIEVAEDLPQSLKEVP